MPSKLNKNAQKLVDALESGNYRQCTGQLGRKVKGERVRYCCLGVACQIYKKEHPEFEVSRIHRIHVSNIKDIMFNGQPSALPYEVREWYGFSTSYGSFKNRNTDEPRSLTELNDMKGMSFKEIAKVIRSKPKGLFVRKAAKNPRKKTVSKAITKNITILEEAQLQFAATP